MALSEPRQSHWLDVRLTTLDEQLHQIDIAVREQQQSQLRIRELENELRRMLERGANALAALARNDPSRHSASEQARRLREWQVIESRLRDLSERRIHEFERRLQHEWEAIRQLHELPIKALEQRAADAHAILTRLETRLQTVDADLVHQLTDAIRELREATLVRSLTDADRGVIGPMDAARQRPRAATYLLIAILALGAYTVFVHWRLGTVTQEARARATAAEQQTAQAGQFAERERRAADEAVQRATGEASASAARTERVLNVLTATDLRRFLLAGQPAAPTAIGQALWSRSRGMVLTASRLPAAPADRVHQAWLVTSRGTISLGVATPDAQGRVSTTFDLPSDLPGIVLGVMLTLERTGGSATPSGPVVIAS
jgi:hypothetical protein